MGGLCHAGVPGLPRRLIRLQSRGTGPKGFRYDFYPWARSVSKSLQKCFSIFLLVTIVINLTFIIQKTVPVEKSYSDETSVAEAGLLSGLSRRNNFRLQESSPKSISIEVLSSQNRVSVTVDGTVIVDSGEDRPARGVHVLILHEGSGAVMAQRTFDTYSPHEDEALSLFLGMISPSRLIVMAVKDEASFQLKSATRQMLKALGTRRGHDLGWRDMWAVMMSKGGEVYGEELSKSPGFNSWGAPVMLKAEVSLVATEDTECDWPDNEENKRRKEFCNHIEGYGSVCSCSEPAPLSFTKEILLNNQISNIPVAIIASNRPHYLYRCLRSLLSATGVNPEMILVFIDGYYEEPLAVTKLFGVRGIQHTPLGSKNARITQHYKASLTATFNIFPLAQHVIILEEDLDVSKDFFSYFSQTLHVLEQDPSLFCISAWNDQGYEHTSSNPSQLYRVETMPGLGWILKKKLYKEELERGWPTPEKLWDWDMWMRLPEIQKGRECIIPDVSRTYHFGSSGLNMNSYFQDTYFKKRSFNVAPYVDFKNVDSLKKNGYEIQLSDAMREAKVLDHTKNICSEDFFPKKNGHQYLLFVHMANQKDFTTWLQVAKCLRIWDLDGRGAHNGMWRLHINSNPIFVIGFPYSPYSKWKPAHLKPLRLQSKDKINRKRIFPKR